jgi:glycosyltransferase involved in cell wall biosynthesis
LDLELKQHKTRLSKIVILGPAHPLRGGLATYNERLCNAFLSKGHQTSIYTFSLQYPSILFPGKSQYSDEPAPSNLDIKVVINSINPFNWFKIGWELKNLKPDIIVVRYWLPFMGPCLGTILRLVKLNKHTKIVCIADNIIPHEKRIGDSLFTSYFIQPIDGFITMSEKVLADLDLFSTKNKKKKFIPHPLYDNFGDIMSKSEAKEHLNLNKDDSYLLFFGFIRKYKGLDLLLHAMKMIQNPSLKLIIAGEFYEDAQPYLKLIDELKLVDRVILKTSFITDSEVKYYFCASDLVVQPYKSATQSGVTPLAYHFEIPMVVTNVGGLTAMVPDGEVGLIAEPNEFSIANKINEYFDRKLEESFKKNLKREKLKYSWDIMTKAIIDIAKK